MLINGPTEELRFTSDEQVEVVADVQNALSWLGSNVPRGNIIWSYDIRPIELTVPAGRARGYEPREARWRDPALATLGFEPGVAGVEDFTATLKTTLGVEFAYCCFFVKYPLGHFAYAELGGPHLVMHYDNDGWGPENIDRVFAHESCHIFGAPDEYEESGCNCRGTWGTSRTPNSNCERCAEGGAVPCIMIGNTWDLCDATPGHLGWS